MSVFRRILRTYWMNNPWWNVRKQKRNKFILFERCFFYSKWDCFYEQSEIFENKKRNCIKKAYLITDWSVGYVQYVLFGGNNCKSMAVILYSMAQSCTFRMRMAVVEYRIFSPCLSNFLFISTLFTVGKTDSFRW